MKKFAFLFLTFTFPLSLFCGCKKNDVLLPYVIELRENIFLGETEDYTLKAYYGFKLTNENKRYALTLFLADGDAPSVEYTISFDYDGKTYADTLRFDPVIERLAATFYLEGVAEDFTATLSFSSERVEVPMHSTLPDETIHYKRALELLYEKQTAFIDGFFENGTFTAEIVLRVVVKDDKAYYYVGIEKDETLKAFLMDGKTGEVLAIREIR